ncbi:hypothetical protein Abu_2106 [Aliarcobacter butzleri RM4018]|uniref:Uncharacterized protein n=1 Tax=Aliarcobacter butzleri (strain RM4018) TaxID=367737 RepID=A8EWJ7_ALIB4|nr:hypothetical protein [Aliarcobacter butzleri]ABV68320.1 hypothetical protein Abu_2106 [Aliarcobacter butzleri RM4018]GGT79602.1 hypothetical protein GCM10007985_15090 [Aliarcobacter butzleri]SNV33826.1 Uncharacterised protein [Aliarcobacter butzleri]
MDENQINKAIKEMLSKDKRFADKNVKVNFDSKALDKEITKEVNSLKLFLNKKIG